MYPDRDVDSYVNKCITFRKLQSKLFPGFFLVARKGLHME